MRCAYPSRGAPSAGTSGGACALSWRSRFRREGPFMAAVSISVLVVVLVALVLVLSGVRMVQQYQRGVVLRFGRLLPKIRQPGLGLIVPFVDRMYKIPVQTIVLDVPSQGTITRDNV